MAGPIAHILIALAVLAGPFRGDFDERDFLLGTSFPDIRYLGSVDRSQTHTQDVTFEMIKSEPDSFKAGVLLHSWVDQQRERYMQQNHVYDHLPDSKYRGVYLKIIEDLALVNRYQGWSDVRSVFDEIAHAEQEFGVPLVDLQKWHRILQIYLENGPQDAAIDKVLTELYGRSLTLAMFMRLGYRLWVKPIIKQGLEDSVLIQKIYDFYDPLIN